MSDQNNAPELPARIWAWSEDDDFLRAKPHGVMHGTEYIRADRAAPPPACQQEAVTESDLAAARAEIARLIKERNEAIIKAASWESAARLMEAERDEALAENRFTLGLLDRTMIERDDARSMLAAAYHAGIDAAANRYRVCASPDVWDYFYTAYNAMLDLKTFPMPAALASREAQQPAGEAMPVGCGHPCGYDCNGACFDPRALKGES